MPAVELYELGQRPRPVAAESGQVGVQIVLELTAERDVLRLVDLLGARQLDRVGEHRAAGGQQANDVIEYGRRASDCLRGPVSPDADPGACQRPRIEELGVVGVDGLLAPGWVRHVAGRRIGWVEPGDRPEQNGGVGYAPGHRAGRVLRRGDGHDARTADQAERRLEPDDAAVVRRADDRAVGLGADRERGQPGGHCHRRARTRAGRIPAGAVRVHRLTTQGGPAARRMGRAEVRPFRHVGLAEDHRPGGTELTDQERVLALRSFQSWRARGGGCPVDRDVVFD